MALTTDKRLWLAIFTPYRRFMQSLIGICPYMDGQKRYRAYCKLRAAYPEIAGRDLIRSPLIRFKRGKLALTTFENTLNAILRQHFKCDLFSDFKSGNCCTMTI